LIDFWSKNLKSFDIKKVPNISGLDLGVDPDAIGRTPDPLLVRKKRPVSRFLISSQYSDY
jgi:hypothetical protein